jgi:outer membrane receptor protein involved in Fe transport
VARTFHRRTYSGELGETATLSPNLLNNLRLQFQLASPITKFDPVIYSTQFVVPISSGGTLTSGTSQNALLMNRQYELSETLSIASGRHQIAVGGGFIEAHNGGNSKEFGGPISLGKFTYNTCTQAASICENSAYLNNIKNAANYQQSFGNQNYTVDDQLFGIFAQDDYRAGPRVTINLGLRYERQTFTNAKLNFAPRMGSVYDVFGTGNTIFRARYGIYHSQIVDNSFASYALGEPSGVFTYTATPSQVGFPTRIPALSRSDHARPPRRGLQRSQPRQLCRL